MVEFSTIEEVDLDEYRALNMVNAHGTLGLITVNGDIFLVVVNGASKVATVRPGETIQRIHSVGFCERSCDLLTSLESDWLMSCRLLE